jgi:hypothetical protein
MKLRICALLSMAAAVSIYGSMAWASPQGTAECPSGHAFCGAAAATLASDTSFPNKDIREGILPFAPSKVQPRIQPDFQSDLHPNFHPSLQPTLQPNIQPNIQPSIQPNIQPKIQPNIQPNILE